MGKSPEKGSFTFNKLNVKVCGLLIFPDAVNGMKVRYLFVCGICKLTGVCYSYPNIALGGGWGDKVAAEYTVFDLNHYQSETITKPPK